MGSPVDCSLFAHDEERFLVTDEIHTVLQHLRKLDLSRRLTSVHYVVGSGCIPEAFLIEDDLVSMRSCCLEFLSPAAHLVSVTLKILHRAFLLAVLSVELDEAGTAEELESCLRDRLCYLIEIVSCRLRSKERRFGSMVDRR